MGVKIPGGGGRVEAASRFARGWGGSVASCGVDTPDSQPQYCGSLWPFAPLSRGLAFARFAGLGWLEWLSSFSAFFVVSGNSYINGCELEMTALAERRSVNAIGKEKREDL